MTTVINTTNTPNSNNTIITESTTVIGTSSASLVGVGTATKRLEIFNVSGTGIVWISFNSPAVVGQGYPIPAGGGYAWAGGAIPKNAIYAISTSGTNTLTVWAGN